MDNDDAPVGRILSRREALALLGVAGAGGAALLVGCSSDTADATEPTAAPGSSTTAQPTSVATQAATQSTASSASVPACVVKPALTEGPYFVDEKLNRSDIRSDPSTNAVRQGALLTLTFNVSRVGSNACSPLANATVDVWHCDALGVYSDATDPGFNTKGQKFLRGYQTTDQSGRATFTTIYPGWYQGRAVHIHFKIRSGNSEFTSQLFFDDNLSAQVFSQAPYSAKGTGGWLRTSGDSIFRQSNGLLTLDVARSGDGYAATFDIGVQA
jgi:protocatechuate 3,4-dioxygenase beta subunit